MWAYILKDDIDNFLYEHQELSEHFNDVCLLETINAFFVPRLFINNYPSQYLKVHHGKVQVNPENCSYNFTKKLRDNQLPIVNRILDLYATNNKVNGIIRAQPGIGKTVLSIYLASKLGWKTCIIVDNGGLMKQWIQAILDFTNLTKGDIGIIQQNIWNVSKPITIAMVQTLCSRIKGDITKAFKSVDEGRFGLVIYDEVHASSATNYFSKSTLLFRSPNVIGLSATPFHYGAQEILMKNTIGDIIYETNAYEMKPKYTFAYYDSGLGNRSKHSFILGQIADHIQKKSYYNKIVATSDAYYNIIKDFTKQLYKEKHRIIILALTKIQVKTISDTLTKFGLTNRKYYGDDKEDVDKINDNIIVATYKFCGKGFDYSALSAIILATPLSGKKSIIQSIGRILRKDENKNTPVVIDLIDMAFPSLFIPEVRVKKKLIKEEYDVEFEEQMLNKPK